MADLPDWYTLVTQLEAEAYKFRGGADAAKSATPTARDAYFATDTKILYVCVVDGVWTGFDASMLVQGILTLYANLAGGGYRLTNIANPTSAQDAATKKYHDDSVALYLPLAGGTMSGAIAMGTNKITGLGDPTAAQEAATRAYVLAQVGAYLLLTGGTLSGDLNIGANKLKTTDLLIMQWSADYWALRDDGNTLWKDLILRYLDLRDSIKSGVDGGGLLAKNTDGNFFAFKARDSGEGWVEVARLQGAADAYFQATLPMVLLPASEPGTLVEGHFWYCDTAKKLKYRDDAAVQTVAVGDFGQAIFGDGSDGDVVISSNTNLTRDMFYDDLTVNNGVTLSTKGYRIFCSGTLTNNGTIENNGAAGTNGTAGAKGAGGAAGVTGSLGGGGAGGDGYQAPVDVPAIYSGGGGGGGAGDVFIAAKTIVNSGTISANGGAGGNGSPDEGTAGALAVENGTAVSPSLGGNGGAGGDGTDGGAPGGTGGTTTAPTAAKGGFRSLPFAAILKEIESTVAKIGGGGGGGGGGASTTAGGCGGGGGGGGLLVLIYDSLTTGTETAALGAGGTGTDENGANGVAGTVIKIPNV